jgi:hypothetical protein
VGEDLLGGFRLGALAGPFDEFAVDDGRPGTGQGGAVRLPPPVVLGSLDEPERRGQPSSPRAGRVLVSLLVSFSYVLRRSASITRNRQPRSRTHLTSTGPRRADLESVLGSHSEARPALEAAAIARHQVAERTGK